VSEKKNWRTRKSRHHLPRLLPSRRRKRRMRMAKSTIPLNCLLVGMVNPFHSGCISYTVLGSRLNVSYVVNHTEDER
jgi:hypothetical protein